MFGKDPSNDVRNILFGNGNGYFRMLLFGINFDLNQNN